MADYILFSSIRTENLVTISEEYIHVKKVIKLLCHTDPISGVFQFSLLGPNERKAIALLANGKSASEDSLNSIYQSLFRRASRKLVENSPQSENNYNYFPAFTTSYMLPVYENLEVESAEPCLKKFPTHKRFSPGIVAITCKHRICYGFQILRQHESTVVIYNLLMTIFREQPKVIIYDNACNLHKTCMKRDPKVFRKTTFLIDRFHSTNHKCNPSYSSRSIQTDEMKKLNSQICEQLFPSLTRIATQIAYMRIDNVFFTTRCFLACLNLHILSQINKI
ncbi:hypothetical protein LOD99_10743 [Oopsacas minuta]|uniref:Transposase n=1 Tax=Oopsacas minuta TaxID=111878 RepID=A0AAV7KF48_9METZ|nr:hypothetical protein LOD99_10743 [Oopsacas minuta]